MHSTLRVAFPSETFSTSHTALALKKKNHDDLAPYVRTHASRQPIAVFLPLHPKPSVPTHMLSTENCEDEIVQKVELQFLLGSDYR